MFEIDLSFRLPLALPAPAPMLALPAPAPDSPGNRYNRFEVQGDGGIVCVSNLELRRSPFGDNYGEPEIYESLSWVRTILKQEAMQQLAEMYLGKAHLGELFKQNLPERPFGSGVDFGPMAAILESSDKVVIYVP